MVVDMPDEPHGQPPDTAPLDTAPQENLDLEPLQLSPTADRLLHSLLIEDQRSGRALASALGLHPRSVSRAVDELIAWGAVRVVLSTGSRTPPRDHPRSTQAELRRHPGSLPYLLLLDGTSAAVEVVADGTRREAWTTDPVRVAALQRLFDLFWSEAEPLAVPVAA